MYFFVSFQLPRLIGAQSAPAARLNGRPTSCQIGLPAATRFERV
jgi:hypothetical protein